jgi:hypothetical protein
MASIPFNVTFKPKGSMDYEPEGRVTLSAIPNIGSQIDLRGGKLRATVVRVVSPVSGMGPGVGTIHVDEQ